ncbi:MAG: hypothetical protein KJ623_04800 [Nanoarchaeota archaeon]|nr:hypothetical protein [Nanoarchaeota archaeon]
MKKVLLTIMIFVLLLAGVKAEIVTSGSVIDLDAIENPISSLDIKDVIKADLLRPYGSDEFQIDASKLPSLNDMPYVLTQITDKPIIMTNGSLTINGKSIKLINGYAFLMPLTKYTLAKNLRISISNDKVKIEDSKISFQTTKVVIREGIVYVDDNNIPLRVMPNMIFNDLIIIFGEDNLRKTNLQIKNDKVSYDYQFERPAKLLYLFDTKMNIDIVVDANTAKYKIEKPFWSLFTSGENGDIKSYNFTKYAAF